MGGPRVTSGADSKQDYSTPDELLVSVEKRFGPIQFDLAAHAANAKHARYYAPGMLERKKFDLRDLLTEASRAGGPFEYDHILFHNFVSVLVRQGASKGEVELYLEELKGQRLSGQLLNSDKFDFSVLNHDIDAFGFNSLSMKNSWAELSQRFSTIGLLSPHSVPGLLWDNCEFSDIEPWARKHYDEMKKGANSLLLTPVSMANWARDLVFGKADVYLLSGRLSFDGKNVFPKDCMLSHFAPWSTGKLFIWNWKKDVIVSSWTMEFC